MDLKKVGYLGAYLIAPLATLSYELTRSKEKRNKSRIIFGSGIAVASLLFRAGILLGSYEIIPEKFHSLQEDKIKNKKNIEKKFEIKERSLVDSVYFHRGLENNRKVYKE